MKNILKILTLTIIALNYGLFAQDKPTHKSLVTGFAFVNLEKSSDGNAQFEVGFNPIILWKINNNFLFESELEFELEDGRTNVALEYAQMLYIANSYITVGVGKFLNPINLFAERYHPAWINKLPTMPLGFSGHGSTQIISSTQVGLQVRGGIPIGSTKIVYSFYASNGPALNAEKHEEEGVLPKALNEGGGDVAEGGHATAQNGTLNYANIPDNNGNKALGGRIGFIPIPQLEIGFGFETAVAGTDGTDYANVTSTTTVTDFAFIDNYKSLGGRVDVRASAVWLSVDNPNIEPLTFLNNSNSSYGQIAFQPSLVNSKFIKDFEFVFRYDQIDLPTGSDFGTDQNRYTYGLNYWFNYSTAVKFAYESLTSTHEDGDESENGFVIQLAMGF